MTGEREDGFTLVEALTALAVASLAGAGLMSALGSARTRTAEAETRAHALARAQELLTIARSDTELDSSSARGADASGRLSWTVDLGPIDDPSLGLQAVTVTVGWSVGAKKGVTRLAAYRVVLR